MSLCPGCYTHLHEGQDYMLHTITCVYARIGKVREAMDKLASEEPESLTYIMPRRLRLNQSEGCRRYQARRRGSAC